MTIRRGSTGAAVSALQRALNKTADGSFGPATEVAVREYQRSKDLVVDGVVNPNVWNALMGKEYTKAPSAQPDHELQQYAALTLRRGSSGAAVSALQKALGGITVDGSFGPATEAKVREYQRSKDLASTGVVTAEVWNALIGR